MKIRFKAILFAIAVLVASPSALANPPEAIQIEAKNSYIFKFDATVSEKDMLFLAASLTEKYHGILRHVFTNVIHGFSASMSGDDAAALVNDNAEVTDLINNGVGRVPSAASGASGGKTVGSKGKPVPSQIKSWGVDVVGGAIAADNKTRHAWIIDTGIDDYYAGVELNIGEGENFVSKGKRTTDDSNGHGTHIAGILAAKDNEGGVLGIAEGAIVHPVRVLHNNLWGTIDDIIAGVNYVATKIAEYPHDKHVVNMSLTIEIAGQEEAAAEFDMAMAELASVGVDIAVCAGNGSTDANDFTPAYLSAYHDNIFTVASIDSNLHLATDSNTGMPPINFVAPGVGIESLKPGGGTWTWSGCSMATPHVAGILLYQMPVGVENETGYPLATHTQNK